MGLTFHCESCQLLEEDVVSLGKTLYLDCFSSFHVYIWVNIPVVHGKGGAALMSAYEVVTPTFTRVTAKKGAAIVSYISGDGLPVSICEEVICDYG